MNVAFLIIVMILLIAFSFISQHIKAKQSAKMQSMIAPGVTIKTFSGLEGTVVRLDNDKLVLEIAKGVETVWSRNSVAAIVNQVKTTGSDTATSTVQSSTTETTTGKSEEKNSSGTTKDEK
jgi:preprotein translocase subunit YajC